MDFQLILSLLLLYHLLIKIISMKSTPKQTSPTKAICPQHKQKIIFVCLQKNCNNSFKLGCIKCRKQHAQHPNRLVGLNQFHKMLSKPIKYMQNSTAFNLMNLKKKVQYIKNFRTSILEKQLGLTQSNQRIKKILGDILEQHYKIRQTVDQLDQQKLQQNFQNYQNYLLESKQFLAYNPVKCELVYNKQTIKTSRVALEKSLQISYGLIGNIRQYLVKIIEVLLANCTHEEDDDEIEYEEEGDGATTFNIVIKKRTEAVQNPVIKNKIEHTDFLELFDEQKQAFTQQIQHLEKQIESKSIILNRIKSINMSNIKQSQITQKDQKEESKLNQSTLGDLQNENTILKEQISKLKASASSFILSTQSEQYKFVDSVKSDFMKIIKEKDKELNQSKNHCEQLQQKINKLNLSMNLMKKANKTESAQPLIRQKQFLQKQLQKQKNNTAQLKQGLRKLKIEIKGIKQKNKQYQNQKLSMQKEIESLKSKLIEANNLKLHIKTDKEKQNKQIKEINQTSQKLRKSQKLIQELQSTIKQNQVKMHEMVSLLQNKTNELDLVNRKLQQLQEQFIISKNSQQNQKQKILAQANQKQAQIKQLMNKLVEVKHELELKNEQIEKQLKQKSQIKTAKDNENIDFQNKIKLLDQVIKKNQQQYLKKNESQLLMIKQFQKQQINFKQSLTKVKNQFQQQHKKNKQVRQMLEIAIKKNQDLKDKNYQLESEIQAYKLESINRKATNQDQEIKKPLAMTDRPSLQSNNKKASDSWKLQTETSFEGSIQKRSSFKNLQKLNSIKRQENQGLRQKIMPSSNTKMQAYLQIKNIFKAVSEDMNILEERLKQNTVIEKVYLKQLQRKRNENKTLKKQLENVKVFGGIKTEQTKKSNNFVKERQKIDLNVNINSHNVNGNTPKADPQVYVIKKPPVGKVNVK